MRERLAAISGIPVDRVSVKATRPEGLGLVGDGIGCLALAVVAVSDELVTGRRAVVEALRAGQVREVLVAAGARDTQGLRAVREAARAAKVPVRATDRRELDRLADDHRGVVARTVGGRAGRTADGGTGPRHLPVRRPMRSSSSWTGSRIRRTWGPRRGRPRRPAPRPS